MNVSLFQYIQSYNTLDTVFTIIPVSDKFYSFYFSILQGTWLIVVYLTCKNFADSNHVIIPYKVVDIRFIALFSYMV